MPNDSVVRLADTDLAELRQLLARYRLRLQLSRADEPIPGSYWGDQEAGLIGDCLYARDDTPLHSILHEAGHYICMDQQRRAVLQRDAGSDDAEEIAVCYLQVLLADELPDFGRERMLADMDRWGYSFRLGSAGAWFEQDAEDARQWLFEQGLVDARGHPTLALRKPIEGTDYGIFSTQKD